MIEFQRRGLPHAHILIVLREDDKLKTADHVDDIVCAELPPAPESIFDDDPRVQLRRREQAKRLQDAMHV